ncbi:MAG: MarR family transcriptional regulator [Pirellulales bacterium]
MAESKGGEQRSMRFDSPAQELYLNLWRTYDKLRKIEEDLFERFELTCQQYNVLRLLKSSHPEPLPTLTIAERLVSRAPDITRMIDRLESMGLTERRRPESDRRQVLIAITDAGLKLVQSIAEPLSECHQKQLGHMSDRDIKQLCSLLKAARKPHEEQGSSWS